MITFNEAESRCRLQLSEIGSCYHLWTPENFPIIFTCDEDFKAGMGIIGICAKLYPEVCIITFELMSNHIHITAAGTPDRIAEMFDTIKRMLIRFIKSQGRSMDWSGFKAGTRKLTTLEEVRNVIVYNNKNGFVVSPEHTPFSYPWGANRFFFNPDAKELAHRSATIMTYRERRRLSRSHLANNLSDLLVFQGYALPLSFCHIEAGEKLFRNASHYFGKIAAVCRICNEKYSDGNSHSANGVTPSQLSSQEKIEMAKVMRYDYNASDKQIQRMLKLDSRTIINILGQ